MSVDAMDAPRARNVLIVANRTAATPALLAEVGRRASEGACRFTLLVPRPYWDADTEESAITLELAIPLLEDAAGGRVEGLVGSEDPFLAVSAALEAGPTTRSSSRRFPRACRTGSISTSRRACSGSGSPSRSSPRRKRTARWRAPAATTVLTHERTRDASVDQFAIRIGPRPTARSARRSAPSRFLGGRELLLDDFDGGGAAPPAGGAGSARRRRRRSRRRRPCPRAPCRP